MKIVSWTLKLRSVVVKLNLSLIDLISWLTPILAETAILPIMPRFCKIYHVMTAWLSFGMWCMRVLV